MDEDRLDALFSRYVEQLVVHDVRSRAEDLASADPELIPALRARIEAFHELDDALTRPIAPLAGKTLSHFRIMEKIGAGGMGEVYRAEDLELRRQVAVKVLPAILALDPQRRARFEREARLLAALNHPAIASIYGVVRSAGVWFLVLELVPGETLAQRIARGPLPLAEACLLLGDVAAALEAAHAKGIVHRDFKPANLKITDRGSAKVLDFGLGKALEKKVPSELTRSATASLAHTVTGTVVGTAAYMSPEQVRGGPLDPRTDVWSFGCVLYEAVTGRPAFAGDSLADVAASVLYRDPDWSALPAGTPVRLRNLLGGCLEKDLDRRLGDMAEARTSLAQIVQELDSRRPRAQWIAAAIAIATLAGAAGSNLLTRQPPAAGATASPSGDRGRSISEVAPGPSAVSSDRTSLDAMHALWRERYASWRAAGAEAPAYRAYVTTRDPPTISVIGAASNTVTAVIAVPVKHPRDILTGLAVTPDGTRLYAAAQRETDGVVVADTASNTLLPVPDGPAIRVGDEPHRLAITPDGSRAYVTTLSGAVSVIDTDPRSATFHTVLPVPGGRAIRVGRKPRGIAIAPSGARAYVANSLSDSVSVIDTEPRSRSFHRLLAVPDGAAIRVDRQPIGLGMDPQGTRLYVSHGLSDSVSVIDIDPRSPTFHTVIAVANLGDSPGVLAVTPDGGRAYLTLQEISGALVVDTASRSVVRFPGWAGAAPSGFAISPDGRRGYAARSSARDIVVVDTDPTSATFHTIVAAIPLAAMPFDVAFAPARPSGPAGSAARWGGSD